ncbi:MAG: delta-60 repeat domain-containing protein [Verrucomicrobiales bacterium]|nr:delta-60 repeat domain-containing protein [Verrucomicrobiales bacterium]
MKALTYLLRLTFTLVIAPFTILAAQVDLTPGILDPSFNPGSGPNNTVFTAVVSPDDFIWIGGRFTEVDGHPRHGLARLTPSGAVDPSFVSPLDLAESVAAIALLPGTREILVSWGIPNGSYGIAFISPDGSTVRRIDTDTGVVPKSWGGPTSIVVLSDGETLVTATDSGLVFFLPNGLGGYTQKPVAASVMWPSVDRPIGALTVDGSGRPIAAGGFHVIGGVEQAYFARFLPNGDLDPEFMPEIPYKKPGPWLSLFFWGATALPNGSLVGALEQTFRLDSKGSIDPDFQRTSVALDLGLGASMDGTAIRNPRVVPLPNDYSLFHSVSLADLTVDPAARIYRLRPDGSIASGWNVPYSPQGGIQDVAVDRRGNVIMVGSFTNVLGKPLRGVARLLGGATDTPPVVPAPPARIDVREGTDLILTNHPTTYVDPFAAQWFFGDQAISNHTNPLLTLRGLRPRQAGPYSLQVSNAFGVTRTPPAEVQVIPYPSEPGRVDLDFERPVVYGILPKVVARQSDGKWLVAGKWSSQDLIQVNEVGPHTLRRLLPDGSLDSEFRPVVLKDKLTDHVITALAVQEDGKILVGGSMRLNNPQGVGFLVRLQTDGSVDTSFTIHPSLMTLGSNAPPTLLFPRLTGIAIQPSGRILCSGTFQSGTGPAAFAFQTNGAVDAEYTQRIPSGSSSAVVAMRDGRTLLLGDFKPPLDVTTLLIRLRADGSLDESFRAPPQVGYEKWIQIVKVDDDGSCLATRHDWQAAKTRLLRLDSTGSVITSWDGISGSSMWESPPMVALPDNRVVAAWVDTRTVIRPVQLAVFGPRAEDRWETNRSLATAPPFTPPQSTAYLLGADPEGRVLLGGLFSELDGIPRLGLARLNLGNVAAGPTLLRPKRTVGRFEVEIATSANRAYELQRAPNLNNGPWTSVVQVIGNGGLQVLADPAPADAAAFYRVRVE